MPNGFSTHSRIIGFTSKRRNKGRPAPPIKVTFQVGDVKYSRHFYSVIQAVSFTWEGRKGCRVEGGQMTVPTKSGYMKVATFYADGRKLTTDDLVPAIQKARINWAKKQANVVSAIARLNRLDAEDAARVQAMKK